MLCLVCAALMVSYWLYKFTVEDRSVGVVDYLTLHEATDIEFPALSLCFENPFLKEKLNDSNIDVAEYLSYLKGEIYDEKLANLNYNDVTLKLDDYFTFGGVGLRKETRSRNISSFILHKQTFDGFVTFDVRRFVKCFSVSITDYQYHRNVERMVLAYNRDKLLGDVGESKCQRPNCPLLISDVYYPEQFLIKVSDSFMFDIKEDFYGYRVLLRSLEMLKRRNTRTKRCTYDTTFYDRLVLEKHISTIGCRAPYHKTYKQFPICNTKEKIKKSLYEFQDVTGKYYPKTCQRIAKLDFDSFVNQATSFGKVAMMFGITYPEEAKVITQSQAVDVHSLIGNVGGYIGLFLGNYCLLYPLLSVVKVTHF